MKKFIKNLQAVIASLGLQAKFKEKTLSPEDQKALIDAYNKANGENAFLADFKEYEDEQRMAQEAEARNRMFQELASVLGKDSSDTSSEAVSQMVDAVRDLKETVSKLGAQSQGDTPVDVARTSVRPYGPHTDKFAFGARRITVSTCGIVDKLSKLAEDKFPFRLAISLHGATDEVRGRIMPINKKFPLATLLDAAEKFAESNGRMITLEYILIKDVNDSFAQAHALAKIAKRLHAHVNLIPYNRVEALPWKRSDLGRRAAFAKVLKDAKVSYTLRREKGAEIDAACGQLALKKRESEK